MGLAALLLSLYVWFGAAPPALVFDRCAFQQTLFPIELHRFLSAHLVHSDGRHLTWNLAGLLILGMLFERGLGRWFFPILGAGAVGVGLWLWGFSGLRLYCGLSGVLNSILAAGLVLEYRQGRARIAVFTVALCLGKFFVEMAAQQALFTNTAWAAAPGAHLAGFISGALFMGAQLWIAQITAYSTQGERI